MRTIRASEIGSFLFCRRAWWYQGQGIETENQAELAGGSMFHRRHGQTVLLAGLLWLAAWVLMLVVVVLLTVELTTKLFP